MATTDDYSASSATTASLTNAGSVVFGQIEKDGDVDWIAVPYTVGSSMYIEIFAENVADQNFSPVFSIDLIPNANNSTSFGGSFSGSVGTSGVAYFAVQSYSSVGTGAYSIKRYDSQPSNISLSGYSGALEGNDSSTPFTIYVWRNQTTSSASVSWSVSGVGDHPANTSDFDGNTFPGGTLSFNAGESQSNFTINIKGDTQYENNERFAITLNNANGASLGKYLLGVTIPDDDVATGPTLEAVPSIDLIDTAADDSFDKTGGTLVTTAEDGAKLTYGISGGKSGVKAGTYGTLKLNTQTGAYTYTPNDKSIEALSENTSETFTMTVTNGTDTDSTSLVINLTGAIDQRTGTAANNRLTGTEGIDSMTGLGGVDNLSALGGNDIVDGGEGKDILNGGTGDDRLIGGAGSDNLTGGKGIDTFVFNSLTVSTEADKVLDFTSEDKLEFSTSVYTKLANGTEENLVSGKGKAAVAVEEDDYLIYDSQTGKLYYDADGSGETIEQILIAGIRGVAAKTLSISSFEFV